MTKAALAHTTIHGLNHVRPETTYTITGAGTTTLATGDVASVAASIAGTVSILSTGTVTVTGSTGGDVQNDYLSLGASTVAGSNMNVRLGDGDTVHASAGIYNMTMLGSVGDSVVGIFHAGSVVNLGGGVDTVNLQGGSIGSTVNANSVSGGYNNDLLIQAQGVTVNMASVGSIIADVTSHSNTFNLGLGSSLTVQDFSTVAGGVFNYNAHLTHFQVDDGSTVVLSGSGGYAEDVVTFSGSTSYTAAELQPYFHAV